MLYQLSYTPDLTIRVGAEKKRGLESAFSSYHITTGAALYEARTAEQVWESFPLIEDSIYKRRSTGETTVALTETIYEKGKVVFLSGGFDRKELCSMV